MASILNSSQKLELPKDVLKFLKEEVGDSNGKEEIMIHILRKNIEKSPLVPDTIIHKDKVFNITSVDPEFIINKYELIFNDNILKGVRLVNSRHPNCDPENGMFCLPEGIKDSIFTKEMYERLKYIMRTFNLDNCYFMPWDRCTYTRRFLDG